MKLITDKKDKNIISMYVAPAAISAKPAYSPAEAFIKRLVRAA